MKAVNTSFSLPLNVTVENKLNKVRKSYHELLQTLLGDYHPIQAQGHNHVITLTQILQVLFVAC